MTVPMPCPWCQVDLDLDLELPADDVRCAECSTVITFAPEPRDVRLAEAA